MYTNKIQYIWSFCSKPSSTIVIVKALFYATNHVGTKTKKQTNERIENSIQIWHIRLKTHKIA